MSLPEGTTNNNVEDVEVKIEETLSLTTPKTKSPSIFSNLFGFFSCFSKSVVNNTIFFHEVKIEKEEEKKVDEDKVEEVSQETA